MASWMIDARRDRDQTADLRSDDRSAAGEAPGAVAARCFHLAQQIEPGPVRQALLEMATDYTGRARDSAKTAKLTIELSHADAEIAPSRLAPLRRMLRLLFAS